MAKYRSKVKKVNIKWVVTAILLIVLSISMVGLSVRVFNNETIKKINGNFFNYQVGTLDFEGKFDESKESIVSKNFISVDGLDIEVAEDAKVSYKLYFYDKDNNFVEASEALTVNCTETVVPEGAKYFKIVITPSNDDEVTLFEINDYAGQLTVTINK